MKKYYTQQRRRRISYIQQRKANCIGHNLRRVFVLKHVIDGKLERRIEITGRRGRKLSTYCMTITKREDIGN
jgi:hypothetical protein